NCTTPRRNESPVPINPPVTTPTDANPQETLLALMNLLQQSSQTENTEGQPSYLGIREEDTSIFAPAEVEIRKQNPIETRAKKRRVDEENAILIGGEKPENKEITEGLQPTLIQHNLPEGKKEDEYYKNLNPNNLGVGEAWWNLNSDDDYEEERDYDWNREEFSNENEGGRDERSIEELLTPIDSWPEDYQSTSEIPPVNPYDEIIDFFDFYFDEKADPVVTYNVEGLQEDQKDKILPILKENSNLFARDISELGRTNKCQHHIITGDALPIKQHPYRHSLLEKKDKGIPGTLGISSRRVTYDNPQSNDLDVVNPRRLTEAQKVHLRMSKFLEDLQRREVMGLQMEEAIGITPADQIEFLCRSLDHPQSNPSISSQYYYLLGERSNNENWKPKILEVFPKKYRDIQKTAQRVYELYTYRGLPNLLVAQNITPYILLRMYDRDYALLIQEAKTQKLQEDKELIHLYETFAGAQ
ncbi:1043_t:CDS:2, partial [Dentiscutata heterogama]